MPGYYLHLAWRSLKRTPILTALMVLAIGLGIGASMTMLTVLHVITSDPLPGRSGKLFYPQLDPRGMDGYTKGAPPLDEMTWTDAMNLVHARQGIHQADDTGKNVAYVVGVVGHLLNPGIDKYQGAGKNLILPVKAVAANPVYVLRVAPEQREAVKRELPKVLIRVDAARTVEAHIYSDTIASYFHGDRAMVWLLVVVIMCLLAVTALGVVGLSSFWVQQRTHQIGIRRAWGATRADMLRYFLAENFLIVSIGVGVGLLGAAGLNLWLMDHYELHRMPPAWLPAGALVLWMLGQLAPAFRASNVPPVVATRSV